MVTNLHNPTKWKKKLADDNVTYKQVKKAMIRLHSPYIDSTHADYLSRLKLGKTLFNNQLYAIDRITDNTCNTCIREYNQLTTEDYRHALFHCPAVQIATESVTSTFFPNISAPFNISDILLSTDSDKHKFYKGTVGHELASLIWDFFQVYLIQCRQAQITPISNTAIIKIRSELNRILKLLPKSKLTTFIRASPELLHILTDASS